MAADFDLVFKWNRFPAARTVGEPQTITVLDAPMDRRRSGAERRIIYEIDGGGSGRSWATDQAEAWWKDFSQLPLHREEDVVAFTRRRGLVFTSSHGPEDTAAWYSVRGVLHMMAVAWDEPDENGVSAFTDDNARLVMANSIEERDAAQYLESLKPKLDPSRQLGKVVLEASTLAAYMVMSALLSLRHRTPMRRCNRCHSWYFLQRKDMIYCGPSCRSMAVQENIRAKWEAK